MNIQVKTVEAKVYRGAFRNYLSKNGAINSFVNALMDLHCTCIPGEQGGDIGGTPFYDSVKACKWHDEFKHGTNRILNICFDHKSRHKRIAKWIIKHQFKKTDRVFIKNRSEKGYGLKEKILDNL